MVYNIHVAISLIYPDGLRTAVSPDVPGVGIPASGELFRERLEMAEMHSYVDVKLLACNARSKDTLAAEMGVEDASELTADAVIRWSDSQENQPRRASLTYADDRHLQIHELVLVPYGNSFSMLGVVVSEASEEHPIPGVKYKPVLISYGVLQ